MGEHETRFRGEPIAYQSDILVLPHARQGPVAGPIGRALLTPGVILTRVVDPGAGHGMGGKAQVDNVLLVAKSTRFGSTIGGKLHVAGLVQ